MANQLVLNVFEGVGGAYYVDMRLYEDNGNGRTLLAESRRSTGVSPHVGLAACLEAARRALLL